jgi:hypothetical protein
VIDTPEVGFRAADRQLGGAEGADRQLGVTWLAWPLNAR